MKRRIQTELLKQRTTRTFVAGIAAAPVVAALVTVAILSAAGTQDNDPLGPASFTQALGAPTGVITVIALLLGVVDMAGEYRHQTITTTFLACPRRRDVIVSKLIACSVTGTAMAAMALLVSAAIAVPWLRASDVAVHLDAETARVAVGVIVSTALYGALGVSVGALIRNPTVAATVVLVWLLAIEGLVGDIVGGSEFARWLPAAAGRALVHTGDSGDVLSIPLATAVFVAYVAALAIAATRFTLQRDIT